MKYNVVIKRTIDNKLISEYVRDANEDTIHWKAKAIAKKWTDRSGFIFVVESYKPISS